MTSASLKIALAVSVALNVFAAAGAVTVWVAKDRVEKRVEAERRSGRTSAVWEAVGAMEPETQDRVKRDLRASALRARPDFDEAREARREAIALTQEARFDPVAVAALLERSRASEMRGRARLEADAVEVLGGLDAKDRKALAPILSRHKPRRGRDERPETPEPPPGPRPDALGV